MLHIQEDGIEICVVQGKLTRSKWIQMYYLAEKNASPSAKRSKFESVLEWWNLQRGCRGAGRLEHGDLWTLGAALVGGAAARCPSSSRSCLSCLPARSWPPLSLPPHTFPADSETPIAETPGACPDSSLGPPSDHSSPWLALFALFLLT